VIASIGPSTSPCKRRETISIPSEVESPQPMVEIRNPTIIATNRLRLPSIPPSQPRIGTTNVRPIWNPVATHWVAARSVPNRA
jgi:hypothetical protein